MVIFVVGGSGSGKSSFAEKKAFELSGGEALYYIATMFSDTDEAVRPIERHQKEREGMGFITLELPLAIERAALTTDSGSTLLVESLSDLLANEMFCGEGEDGAADRIKHSLSILQRSCKNLIVVSDDVFRDG